MVNSKSLPDNIELDVVKTDDELEELIEFNAQVHHEDDPEELRRVLENLPGFSREMNFYARDTNTGKIVSSLNAIPSMWSYDGVPIRNLELGWVGTLPEYRRQGLIRALYGLWERMFFEGDYDLSVIQGIPYYYRQFGYDFVIPMDRSVSLTINRIPPAKKDETPDFMSLEVRNAKQSDIEAMMALFNAHAKRLLVTVPRTQEVWEVQEKAQTIFDRKFSTKVVTSDGEVVGYFRLLLNSDENLKEPHNAVVSIVESSLPTYQAVRRTMEFLRQRASDLGLFRVVVTGPTTNNLCRFASSLGGVEQRGWKYQIRIPHMDKFLNRIGRVLESQLESSMFQGLTQDVFVNTYQHCYKLSFKSGLLEHVVDIGMPETDQYRSIRLVPLDFARLVLGVNSIDEISGFNIDSIVSGSWRLLMETLFPKKESSVYYYMC
jgi:hypothetical protein